MAKIYGLFGSLTGKLADTVMSVRNGVQIARKYQPVVYNPSTANQVKVRAIMKAFSQLSAVMAPVIAIPREGNVSSRNLFVKQNYKLGSYAENTASINMDGVQLTKSAVGMTAISASRGTGTISASIASSLATSLQADRVVYAIISYDEDDKLRLAGTAVVEAPGAGGIWEATIPAPTSACQVYAYALRFNTEAARARFADLEGNDASRIATLIATRSVTESDITTTETVSTFVPAQNSKGGDDDPEKKSKK